MGRWSEVDGLVAELVEAGELGVDVGAGPFDDMAAELLLPPIGANGAHASFDARPFHRQRSGVKFRRGEPLGRATSSGGFARRANFNDHETARSCCEPSRRLDAVELRWITGRRAQGLTNRFEALEKRGKGHLWSLPTLTE